MESKEEESASSKERETLHAEGNYPKIKKKKRNYITQT
jgi:hypothetical protein